MKFVVTALAVLGLFLGLATARADTISHYDGFQGGFEISTAAGRYCIMAQGDIGAPFAGSAGLTGLVGKNIGLTVLLYNAGQVGWGFGPYGPNTCTNVHLYNG